MAAPPPGVSTTPASSPQTTVPQQATPTVPAPVQTAVPPRAVSTPPPNVAAAPPVTTNVSSNSATEAAENALARFDVNFMRTRVQAVVAALMAALEPSLRTRVERIPVVFDPNTNEVNAFATCSRAGKPAIAITDGMLNLTANLAQLKAVDDTYNTRLLAEYTTYVARNQKANSPLLSPPAQWLSTEQRNNRATLTRQLQVFDDIIGFTFGHELAHHYLNHLPCTSSLPLETAELGILLTDAVPAFNQPNEAAADVASVRSLLKVAPATLGHALSENGALVQLRFFSALDSARPIDVFTFERTHPPPSIREPIVNSTAQAFRMGLSVTLPWSN